ncbi:HD family hydrolase [Roseomonas sp. HF4]|uniref:HD domain-containing protein n=1 Tax=Roseomonas sp. HF4 TaxID=2562313 RepID=UPI0010C04A82|nr:HD domain-containing protein [Roseomonas sp. HF4]
MEPERAAAILDFLAVADRLKTIERRGRVVLPDGASRRENSAEHCWSLALIGVLLHGDVSAPLDLGRALAMVAVHDLVEIEAGDTFAYDAAARATQAAREEAAAETLFGLLPEDLGQRLRALWQEFEAGATPEARFAAACDRMQGFLQNVLSGGQAWKEHGVTRADTLPRMAPAMDADPAFAALIGRLYDRAEEMRLLGPHT